jgi:hypothetical protein
MLSNRQIVRVLPSLSEIAAAKYLRMQPRLLGQSWMQSPLNLEFELMGRRESSTSRSIMFQQRLCFGFSTEGPEKTSLYLIKHACEELLKVDSLILDKISMIFGMHYILR